MLIRNAKKEDLQSINELLRQVAKVHYDGRPDLFVKGKSKYTSEDVLEIMLNAQTPIFVAVENDDVVGYAFCEIIFHDAYKTLYIDDLCIDENRRGLKIGSKIYQFVKDYAKSIDCYNVTLNVWECNPSAKAFYLKLGLLPYKTCMEEIL